MNIARAIDMEFSNKSRGWHGKEETRMEGYSSYKTSSHISGQWDLLSVYIFINKIIRTSVFTSFLSFSSCF